MNTKLLLIMLMTSSTETLSQSININQSDKEYCEKGKQLSYIYPMDSIRHQVVLDSVSRLLVGRWQLIDIIRRTHKAMPTPEDSIEITIDKQGHAIVSTHGKQNVHFQLATRIGFGNLQCALSEAGRNYFYFRSSRLSDGPGTMRKGRTIYPNVLRVCEEYLELFASTSAGPSYTFKRLTPIQLEGRQGD